MNPLYYPELDETLYREVLPNGLTVTVVPRTDFTKRLAYFVTDYGSIHTDFVFEGKQYHAPAGVAHFLEHKIFERPEGENWEDVFSALGAEVNAYTSDDCTAYMFSATEHIPEALEALLSMVKDITVTSPSVSR